MKEDRFNEIMSQLSFMKVGDTQFPDDRLRKMREVDTDMKMACRNAWDVERIGTLDETRVRQNSRYCPFITLMFCKPIPVGVTIYTLVFESGYMYNWEWFLGAAENTPLPQGQPTDTDELDEDNHTWIFDLVTAIVGLPELKDVGFTLVTDKGFTSIFLAIQLARVWGIALVGMLRTKGRPQATPRGARNYFPFRFPTADDAAGWVRGQRREAFQQLETSRVTEWWLKAEVWLDSRFCTIIATSFFAIAEMQVRRWSKSAKDHIIIGCSATLHFYQRSMGYVDRFNKRLVRAGTALGRCMQRYHRGLFAAFNLGVAVLNTSTILQHLVTAEELASLKKRAGKIRLDRWLQIQLAEGLMDLGVHLAKEELGTAEHRAQHHLAPHWMSRRKRRRARQLPPPVFPEHHKYINFTKLSTADKKLPGGGKLGFGDCANCLARATEDGDVFHTPGGHARNGMPNGLRCPQSEKGCSVCKVNLCKKCWNKSKDNGGWDHDAFYARQMVVSG